MNQISHGCPSDIEEQIVALCAAPGLTPNLGANPNPVPCVAGDRDILDRVIAAI